MSAASWLAEPIPKGAKVSQAFRPLFARPEHRRAHPALGARIMNQQHPVQQQQMQQPPGRTYDGRLEVLENDVSGIKSGISLIMQKLDARSSINWQPIGILVTVLGIIGGMGFTWINSGQGRLELLIAKVEARSEAYVPRADLDKRFDVISQRRDDLQRASDARVERIERDIDTMQKSIVPRGEHGEVWAGQRVKDEALQRQIDQVRKDVSDLNTPRDTIQGILRRLDELDSRPRERR